MSQAKPPNYTLADAREIRAAHDARRARDSARATSNALGAAFDAAARTRATLAASAKGSTAAPPRPARGLRPSADPPARCPLCTALLRWEPGALSPFAGEDRPSGSDLGPDA